MKCNLKRPVFLLTMLVCALAGGVPAARALNLVQEFYLPMPEQQIYQANNAIISGTGSTINSTFSIVVTGDGTVIYYDQWEDGYETDLSNPTQPTTQIWGDGNDAHGIPPGLAHNPLGLPKGTVITLTNNVALPRNPSTILWDARDRVAANKALVISRAGWPIPTGPVFAGAVGVLSTMDYGTNYISPVGTNLANNLFKYVGMFVMAAQNNTTVIIDPKGNGVGMTTNVLNQGESYLVNNGIAVGGRITASKPVQADLLIGHVGASFASDWFTLYPASAWSSSYYTPVGSAASGSQPAYVYLYNPGTNAITINYNTKVGSGSFSVPGTNGVFQFQMPVGSGAGFTNSAGKNFYALCTVAANNTADTAYNWGFTLVPQGALTTEADVGWGPGSADGTVDGSPVWVTALANTKLYVDYKGDHLGSLTDANGNQYDTNFTVTALQSQKIFDPSKNQTGMRVYTVDGTLITAAWGEDPDTASPGNPYIDAGTTVIPFPVPVLFKSAVVVTDTVPTGLSVGDTILYTVQVNNKGLLPLGNTIVIDAPTTNLTYITNTTSYNGSPISDSISNNPSYTPFPLDQSGYTIPIILSQGVSTFQYLVKVNAGGAVSNSVNIAGTAIFSSAYIPPPPVGGATVSLNFTDTNGVPVGLYTAGTNVYVTMTNAVGNTASNSAQTINVTVVDLTTLDLQTITLTETTTNSGVFRNIGGLPTSTTSGLTAQDGILNVSPGDTLSVSYTDPNFGDSASNTAAILVPAPNKQLYLTANGTPGNQFLNRVSPAATAGHGTTYTSIDIGSGGGSGTITLDNTTSTNATANVTVLNVQHTTAGGANYMLVTVGVFTFNADDPVLSVIYSNSVGKSAQALTRLTSVLSGTSSQGARTEIWGLSNPSTTNTFVHVTLTSSRGCNAGVTTFSGVNTASPTGNSVSNSATSGATSSVSVPTTAGQYVVAVAAAVGTPTPAPTLSSIGNGQISLWTGTETGGGDAGTTSCSISNAVTGTTTAMSATWSGTLNGWAICAVPLNAAAGGGGGPATNVTSFVQTPNFASAFTMPSGGTVTITNFITVTNGSLVANHNVTAILKTNNVPFLTLTSPAYNEVPGSNTNLVWTGTLNANITVAAGTNITYVISNGVSGTAFHVNYDSTNAQSVVVLPATTVIQVNTLGVYDAPYPGGSLVTTPVAGSTLYIRANVSDPFGNYDITSLRLAVIGPSPGASFTNTLTDVNVATTNSTSKTYEYQWVTSSTVGGYNIAATANEGTEGVSDSLAASITTIFLDLGTPSSATFITSGGVATNSFPTNLPVWFRVQDLDQNTNSATIDTIPAIITSSSGDSEPVTLIETGPNTGIFTNSIPASTGSGAATNNGVLLAPVGSILTLSYTDPTDPSDTSSATATILPPPGVPGVVMNKTIVSPSGGQVGINQPVTYNLQVVNTGNTILTNVVVTDNYPSGKLTFTGASPTNNTAAPGVLTWTNLGNLTPGQSTNLTVSFTTTAATGTATNFATANGGTATNTSSVILLVNSAAVNVTKILLSPTNTPVAVGSNVVFRITVQNVGNTVINYLPLEDTFSAAYYQFVSSTVTNNGSGSGSLVWTNLAYPTTLATNAIITNDVTMKVVGQGSPANNTATVDFATDIFGNPVPAASSTIGVNTASASINGHVYNDINQSGVFTNGDTGLDGVTLQLFTDPNGDGNPVDGTLVQVTTTDGGGYYELLNLNTGHYVAVETDLPGYASSAPANNRLSLNITNLTAITNANFFDYIPAPSVYSTVSGIVWYDANGNGTNNVGETNIANLSISLVQDVNSNGVVDGGEPVVFSATTDTNGNYSFAGVTPGHYIIQQALSYGYYTTGDSQGRTDSQLVFVSTTGVVSTNNSFFDRLSPTAINDTTAALYFVSTNIFPLTNDISPNGDALTITSATSSNGIVVINTGSTNITFTSTNLGVTTINYTIADAHGGTSAAVITVNVTALANVGLGKSGSATVFAASNLVYTISVTNFGPSPASLVVVTDTLPLGVTFVSASGGGVTNNGVASWNLGTLTNNQVTNVTLTVTAPASGSFTNIASVSSPTPDPNLSNNTNAPVITTVTLVADVAVGKSGAATVFAASNLVYTISVTNLGPSTASGVVVTDALPAGVTFVSASGGGVTNNGVASWNLGTLTNSQVTNLTLTVTAPASGTLTNTAVVNSPTGDPNLTNNTSPPVTTAVTPVADVGVTKAGPANVFAGTNFIYTITVTNAGPSTASNVVASDVLPTNVVFVSASGGGTTNAGVASWTLGTLAIHAATNLTLTVTAPASGTITNTASVSSPTGDPNSTNNTSQPVGTSVSLVADVAVGKSGAATVFAVSNLVYTISVTNLGPSTASGVVVTDTLPLGVTFVSASGGGVTNNDIASWNIGTLTNSQVTNLTLTVISPASGTLTNAAIVSSPTGDPNLTNNTSPPVTTTVTPVADVAVGKSGAATVFAVSNLIYTISVTNLGPSTASGVVVTDALPAGVTFVSATGGGVTNNGIASWNIGALTNSQVTNLTLTVTAPASGTLTNTALVNSPTGDPNLTNNTSPPVTTPVTPVADVAVFKTGPTNVAAGGSLTYTITVTNLGPSTASNVVASDVLPTNVVFVSASAGGTTNAGVASWTLGSLNAGQSSNLTLTVTAPVSGTITNVATVASPTGDPNPTNNTSPPATTAVSPVADIGLTKNGPGNVFAATNFSYTITVTNGGPSVATNVAVSDVLPINVVFVSASGGGTTNAGIASWTLGTLVIHATTNLTLTVTAPAAGSITNIATVSSPTLDTNLLNNTNSPLVTTVTPLADLAAGKSGPAGVTFNTGFSYTISVTNLGPSTATAILVTDSLPVGLVFVSSLPVATTNAVNQVIWTNVGDLATGTITNLTLNVISTLRGTVTNLVSIGSPTLDPALTNNVSPPVVTAITNAPPIANPDLYSVSENSVTNVLAPLGNDVVVTPGGVLTVISVSPTNGTAVIVGGTNVLFTPTTNFVGTATIGYTIIDNIGGTNSSLMTISVTNRPPIANPDIYSVSENSVTNVLTPLGNDVVVTPGGSLTVIGVSPTNGTAVIVGGTNVLFTPTTNFVGTATIGYTIIDNIGGTNSSVMTISVTNRPPVANPDIYSVSENSVTNVLTPLGNDVVVTPGGVLTVISVSPTNGTASIVGGTNVLFTPTTNFVGTATIGYTIIDNIGGTNSSVMTISVTNRPPVANPDIYSVSENSVTNVLTPLGNDVVVTPGGVLTVISVSPTNGTASIVGGTNVLFTPTTNFVGTATIGYTIIDNVGGTNRSVIIISVTNRPPIANPDIYSVSENSVTNILTPLGNDVVVTPGGSLTVISVSPTNGTAVIVGGTNVLFTPTTNFVGTATIGYTIIDNVGGTNSSLMTISVTNRPPIANPDIYSVSENSVTNVLTPLGNDVVVTPGGSLTVIGVSPTNGTAVIVGGTNVLFTPTTNFVGTATIGYTIIDNVGGTNSSLMTISVTNRPPIANPDIYSVSENSVTNVLTPLGNDFVVTPGGTLTVIGVSPTNGTAVIVGGTNVLFTPTTNFVGTATIGYTIIDNIGGTNSSVMTISVTNRPPVANLDFYSVSENSVTNILTPLVNDVVVTPGGSLTVIGVSPTNGTAVIVGGTNVLFTPTTNFTGTATIGYTIIDNVGGTNSSLITISVTNRPPVANTDLYSVSENSVTNILTPLVNDVVVTPGGSLTVIGVSPTNGTAVIVGGTNVLFTPTTNFVGTATIGYTIIDNIGGTNSSVMTISVTNRPPVANMDNYSVSENSVTNVLTPLGNDFVVTPGGTLTVIGVSPTNGTAVIVGGTNVLFTPTTNFVGTATIGYTIIDNIGGTNSSVMTISVTNRPPVANVDNYSVSENSVTNVLTPLGNDFVVTPGGSLTVIGVSPTNGTAVIVGGTNVLFTPTTNFTGTATIGYTIIDNIGGTNSSVMTISVTNRPPVANPDIYSVSENSVTNVLTPLGNDVVVTPGGSLTVIGVSPTNGTAVIVGGTNVLFTPTTNFVGTATIGYTIIDNIGGTNRSVITITVAILPPVANGQSVVTLENTPLAIVLTGSDPNSLPLTFVIVSGPTNGALSLLNTNTGSVTYTPNTNYTGADSFTFRVNDGPTNSAVATVAISVLPVADVAIFKTGPVAGVAGSNLTYTVTATNSGPAMATNVVVSDQLPAGFTFVGATPATAVVSNNLVSWPAFNLAANARSNFTVTAVSAEGGSYTNIAFSTASTLDPNTNNNNGTLTNSRVITAVSPLADVAVFKTGNTSIQAGGTVTYTITATNAGPSTATNLIVQDILPTNVTFQTASGSYTPVGNVLTWSAITLSNGSTATFIVTVIAPGGGTFTNVASGTTGTSDPNPTNNNGTASASKVTTSVVPVADIRVFLLGPTNVTVGDGFFYTTMVTNAGPSTAVNTLVTNVLPTNLVFASASGGGVFSNGIVTWPVFASLTNGQTTNLIVAVMSSPGVLTNSPTSNPFNFIETNTAATAGFLTNRASAFAVTFDPNLTNNSASTVYTNAQVQTLIVPGIFSIFVATNTYPTNAVATNTVIPIASDLFIVGTSAFNPQTGLFEENVTVTNRGTVAVHALRLYIGGLRSGVRLYNATGTNSGVPYVEYDPPYNSPLNPYPAANSSVTFVLEFFVSDRHPFTNTLSAVAILAPVTAVGTNGVAITQFFTDTRNPGNPRFGIQFNSVPGRTYTIIYSDDLVTWNAAVPSIVAAANVTQWYDDGPPETLSRPATRFYRVILQP